ncbi:hypothetical protein CBR_g46783 [Chara braunii]|uniref:Uncharacterized protein n=1 Tax=Chara braunii TaxID=69332 RepID=A0A388M0Z6_CHABU|nr:hypothetical protein CBR_g46783 [Chara braunii]|eukprot:GBG88216.1 hypothetical protein CBR_g46783 [Chara braunii]
MGVGRSGWESGWDAVGEARGERERSGRGRRDGRSGWETRTEEGEVGIKEGELGRCRGRDGMEVGRGRGSKGREGQVGTGRSGWLVFFFVAQGRGQDGGWEPRRERSGSGREVVVGAARGKRERSGGEGEVGTQSGEQRERGRGRHEEIGMGGRDRDVEMARGGRDGRSGPGSRDGRREQRRERLGSGRKSWDDTNVGMGWELDAVGGAKGERDGSGRGGQDGGWERREGEVAFAMLRSGRKVAVRAARGEKERSGGELGRRPDRDGMGVGRSRSETSWDTVGGARGERERSGRGDRDGRTGPGRRDGKREQRREGYNVEVGIAWKPRGRNGRRVGTRSGKQGERGRNRDGEVGMGGRDREVGMGDTDKGGRGRDQGGRVGTTSRSGWDGSRMRSGEQREGGTDAEVGMDESREVGMGDGLESWDESWDDVEIGRSGWETGWKVGMRVGTMSGWETGWDTVREARGEGERSARKGQDGRSGPGVGMRDANRAARRESWDDVEVGMGWESGGRDGRWVEMGKVRMRSGGRTGEVEMGGRDREVGMGDANRGRKRRDQGGRVRRQMPTSGWDESREVGMGDGLGRWDESWDDVQIRIG